MEHTQNNPPHGLEVVKVLFLHDKKVTKNWEIVIPINRYHYAGFVLCYWIMLTLNLIQVKNRTIKCIHKGIVYTPNQFLDTYRDTHFEGHLHLIQGSVHLKSIEELCGWDCQFFGHCNPDMCVGDVLHSAQNHLLQICATGSAWFLTPFNCHVYISSVRKGINTFIYMVDTDQENIYFCQKNFNLWSQPENLDSPVLCKICCTSVKKVHSDEYADLKHLSIFSWCFFQTSSSHRFNILQGTHCIHHPEEEEEEEAFPHPHLPPIPVPGGGNRIVQSENRIAVGWNRLPHTEESSPHHGKVVS